MVEKLIAWSIVVLFCWGVLWAALEVTGAADWLRMATSFLVEDTKAERRELTVLRLKLRVLKAIAAAIGRAEQKRSDLGDGR